MVVIFNTLHLQHLLGAKSSDLHDLLIDYQDISWIQETVRNSLAMSIVETICNLLEHIQCLFRAKARLLLENLGKRTALDKGSHKVGGAKLHTTIVDWKNMWMIQCNKR